ncbi:MAG: virA [Bacteroidota bacterium]|nr:virA [Bacteroidota bacterium]
MANNDAKFRISAAVVKQLGEELVSDELTAIMELVKNSYDADADWVKISINTTESPEEEGLTFQNSKGYIIIEDNGHGMNYNDIISRWLFISVSHKREMKEKGEVTKKKRTPLGDKGLGRLSTQRLGHILEMYSCINNESKLHHVAFDWRHFTENSSLEAVDTNYKEVQKSTKKHGTKLVISDLRNPDIWTAEAGDKFRGQLSKLIFPFKESRPFNIYLNINGQPNDLDAINEKLRQQAISSYTFEFDGNKLTVNGTLKLSKLQGNSTEKREIFSRIIQSDNGANFFHFLTNATDNKKYFIPDVKYSGKNGIFITFKRVFDFEKDIKKEIVIDDKTQKPILANPGKFIGEIDEFNISGTEEIESAYDKLSEYKQLVKNQIGVRIFRDGFGIKPYGMGNDDWLQLRKSQTSGGSFYLLRPDNVIGFVSITAKDNRFLIEKTDREGFIDTPYSKAFFNIINLTIQNVNDVLEKTRRSYDGLKSQDAEERGNIRSFKDTKDRLVSTAKQSAAIENETKAVHAELKATSAKVTAAVKRIKNEPLFSTHEENKALQILEDVDKILNASNQLFEKINTILQNAKKLENDANYLEPKINELERQIIQFSELAGLGITAEAFTHEMYNIIDRISAQTEQVAKQNKKENTSNTTFFVYVEHIKSFLHSIRIQLNHLAPSLKFNRETKQNIQISKFSEELKNYYATRFGESILINIKVNSDFSIQINRGKLTQILDNIILNAEYWLKQISKTDKKFRPVIDIEVKSPSIFISDNGYGVLPDFENTIFQPFVTSKPIGEGRGLGLFIVQQLLDSVDSTAILLQKRNEHNRRYIFQINLENLLIK